MDVRGDTERQDEIRIHTRSNLVKVANNPYQAK